MRVTQRVTMYAREVTALAASGTTTEPTYYPAVRALLADTLRELKLPSDVRQNTSEVREGGGSDVPDVAIYDEGGDGVVACVEVKLPGVELDELVRSTERNDQIGRYLAQTGVVILTNVRAFGLLTVKPGPPIVGRVPPERRELERVIELWPSRSAVLQGKTVFPGAGDAIAELVEEAVTRFAVIRTPQMLARVLARQARRAKAALPTDLGATVTGLREDFAKSLGITFEGDEGEEFFRSSLVQTVFYGLFAGWALDRTPETLPIPVVGGLFYDLKKPQRLKALGLEPWIDRAKATLGRVDRESFFARLASPRLDEEFDPGRQAANAILYFYEPFLESFDPDLRKQLGVWYTPPEIVRYQVRRVDRLLRDELGCRLGLADQDVVILDPACGTGAYLIETLLCINERLREDGAGADLGRRLVDALCRRVIGFEILTAPFVVAHLQLLLALGSLGVEPPGDKRLAVFLTNALTGWDGSEQLKLNFPDLETEHEAARQVKRETRIIVVLGNPPYNRFASAPPEDSEEERLVDHYKGIVRDRTGRRVGQSRLFVEWGIRKSLLNELYVRFFRLAEKRIGEAAEHGIVSFISNSSYLTGRSHPLMRESLLGHFDDVWIDNLHGNRLASERTPSGDSCETVFNMEGGGPGIKVGTCISTFVKRRERPKKRRPARVHVRDFWGRAAAKRRALVASLEVDTGSPRRRREAADTSEGPRSYESFTPTKENRWKLVPGGGGVGYEDWPALDELFPLRIHAVHPAQGLDGSVVDMRRDALIARMRDYYSSLSYEAFAAKHPGLCEERARYDARALRTELQARSGFREDRVQPYQLFPLDARYLYYETEGKLLIERSPKLWEHLPGNEFLICVTHPRRESERLPLFATSLFDYHLMDHGAFGFPVEAADASLEEGLFASKGDAHGGRHANLDPAMWSALARAWSFDDDLHSNSAKSAARRLMRACLAICHAPTYQQDHAAGLAQDSAHVPLPLDRAVFDRLAEAGNDVAVLLDPLADPTAVLDRLLGKSGRRLAVVRTATGGQVADGRWVVSVAYFGASKGRWSGRAYALDEPSRPEWGEDTGDLWINDEVHFTNVPERVWRYELGGYPVLKKWLGYRDAKRADGRELTMDEVERFRGMVRRVAALLVLQPLLDELYAAAAANPVRLGD